MHEYLKNIKITNTIVKRKKIKIIKMKLKNVQQQSINHC